jgi:hypothetical protein
VFVLYVATSSKETTLNFPAYPRISFNNDFVCKKCNMSSSFKDVLHSIAHAVVQFPIGTALDIMDSL